MAEPEIIGANHLEFAKSLFQQYNQQLGLNSNHYSAESAFNFYINNKITAYLGRTVNIESARENFYTELFQHTSLPRNYSFTPIIREINQNIERYVQQQFLITYTNKNKGKIQTPAATPKGIQLPNWKKHRIELPTAPSYYYTPESSINISSADASTLNTTLTFRRLQFQSKQRKEDLLEPYGALTNTFTTIKQGETEAVITYLGHFHRNLQQIQAIDANYFTVPQILNQFICGLHSSILQHIHPLHPATLQDAVTHVKDFESAELEANHIHAINLVMNGSSELNSKLKQFNNSIN
ncbi:hypothetical protein G9A89_009540 [Geosiphon pyriformis]|nr:hypothetical protein G9A89_009540 [Geosiphon pyriformis]